MLRMTRWLSLPAILILAVSLRFWQIDRLPPGFHLDESFEGIEACHILTDVTYRPVFLPGNLGVPVLNAYANALMFGLFRIFGGDAGPTAMRITAACFGVLGVWALYALATELRKLEDAKLQLSVAFPLFAAATLAMMRWHIHFSRIGIEPIIVPLLWAAVLWLLLRGWRTGQWINFVGAGILLAASIYAYQSAWVMPFLIIPVALLLLMRRNDSASTESPLLNRQQITGLVTTALVAFILFAPFGWYAWQHQDIVILRPSEVAAGVGTDSDDRTSVWHSITRTANMYTLFGAPGDQNVRRNMPGEPVLNVWEALLFYGGLGIAFWRIRRPGYAIILLSLLALLLPGALSQHAPHYHRLLGASAPTALLCALALDGLWQWRPQRATYVHWASILLLILGGTTSAHAYFVRWAHLPGLYYAFDVGLWQIGQQIAQMPPDQPVYLTPKTANYPTLAFALRNGPHPPPNAFDGRHILPFMAQANEKPELYVVINHEDFRTPRLLPEVLPAVKVQQEFLDWQGRVYARYYVRPAHTVPQRPPHYSLVATLGDGIQLLGYDVKPAELYPGNPLYLQLHWLVAATPKGNWTVFTHLLTQDAAGNPKLVAGQDNPPGQNTLPTNRWQPGWRILDEYEISLPSDLAAGKYTLEIGLYQANGEHLPAQGSSVLLGKVKIK